MLSDEFPLTNHTSCKVVCVTILGAFTTTIIRLLKAKARSDMLSDPHRWHRDLVQGKWTFKHVNVGGRPCLDAELEALIIRLARENPRMGYDKIQGELLKLGYKLDPTTVRNIMRRHHQGLDQQIPVPPRSYQAGSIHCRDVLGGIIHDYFRKAA